MQGKYINFKYKSRKHTLQHRECRLNPDELATSRHGKSNFLKWPKYVNIQIFTQNWAIFFI